MRRERLALRLVIVAMTCLLCSGFAAEEPRPQPADSSQANLDRDEPISPDANLPMHPSADEAGIRSRFIGEKQDLEARRTLLAKLGMVSREPLGFGRVHPSAPVVECGSRLELTIELSGSYDNPFDPNEIDVLFSVRCPDGSQQLVPAFFHLPVDLSDDGTLRGYGDPVWKVRYTPQIPGRYTYTLHARDRTGRAEEKTGSFLSSKNDFDGFVRVSWRQPYALEYDNGRPFIPIGFNLFQMGRLGADYPRKRSAKLSHLLARLADAGGNFVRLRMDSWWLEIEGSDDPALGHMGPGFYNPRVCQEIDRLYRIAEDRGIKIMHVLYNGNGMVNSSVDKDSRRSWRRKYAFFLKENGGSSDTVDDFWTDPSVAKWTRMKLRYCAARWGYSPSLLCWELWNELEIRSDILKDQLSWQREMATYLRGTDPWQHPISSSLTSRTLDLQDAFWKLPEMDLVQHHLYQEEGLPMAMEKIALVAMDRWHKPFLFGEYGIIDTDRLQGGYPYDPQGVHLHNGLWASMMAGSAGAAAFWFVESYVDRRDLYAHYTRLAEWFRDVPWNHPDMRRLEVSSIDVDNPVYTDGLIPVVGVNLETRAAAERFEVNPYTGEMTNGIHFQSILYAGSKRKTRPTLLLDCGRDAALEIHVTRSVGDETNRVVVFLDGQRFAEKRLPAGPEFGTEQKYVKQHKNWISTYNETLTVPLPPGRHEVRMEAFGKDRIEIRCELRSYFRSPPVVIVGRRTASSAWLWARHRMSDAFSLREGRSWKPVRGVRAVLAEFKDGPYRVEWTDTWSGEVIEVGDVTATGNKLKITVPELYRDLAAKIRPSRSPDDAKALNNP